jgi:hypothetical protein
MVALMIAAAVWRLGNELPRLLYEADGAFDLSLRHREVQRWFAGLEVYGDVERGDYPPASYVMLWPLLGWLALAPARWLWALTALVALTWLGWLAAREGRAASRDQVLLLALLPFSVYASSATLAMGQIINHALPLLLGGLLLLHRGGGRLRYDLVASLLLLFALVKPPLSVPFFWIALFGPRRLRPMVLVCVGYAALTLFAVAFQPGPMLSTLTGWLSETPYAEGGHTNLHKWLALAGLRAWMLPASLAILAALARWVYRHRDIDIWILLGVCALAAQFWIHHRLYDHLLIIVPMITLFRIASRASPDGGDVLAAMMFGLTWLTLHAPASVLGYPSPLATIMEAGQGAIWFSALVFLLHRARRERELPGVEIRPATGSQRAIVAPQRP